jgi:hypothetical protein
MGAPAGTMGYTHSSLDTLKSMITGPGVCQILFSERLPPLPDG